MVRPTRTLRPYQCSTSQNSFSRRAPNLLSVTPTPDSPDETKKKGRFLCPCVECHNPPRSDMPPEPAC